VLLFFLFPLGMKKLNKSLSHKVNILIPFGKVIAESLKIRSGLSTDNNHIGLLSKNDIVHIYGKVDNWYIVKTENNLVGAVFADYIERMYEESGLVVQTEAKGQEISEDVNVILDMEQQSEISRCYMREETLYIPVFKRQWIRLEPLQNLDISIPIGYNTVIVKGIS